MDKFKQCKFATFNCKNIKRSIEHVRELCSECDLLSLQETWLYPHDLAFISTISEEFSWTGTSGMDTSGGIHRGRPYGGTALLWRKSVFPSVSVLDCNNPRVCGIRLSLSDTRCVLVFNVYMPTDESKNLPEFTQCLSSINAVIQTSNVEAVLILGDFNAHPHELFCTELLSYCDERDWVCADFEELGIDSDCYTFTSDANGANRWLDHCVVSGAAKAMVSGFLVRHDVFWSDHYPMLFNCNLESTKLKNIVYDNANNNRVLWGERQPEQIEKYKSKCHEKLRLIDFPNDLHSCCDKLCKNQTHRAIIDKLYDDIVSALSEAAIHASRDPPRRKRKQVLGWNKHVASAHGEARLRFQIWVSFGRPRAGPVYDEMCCSRKIFKSKLKRCQQNQAQIKLDMLASQHAKRDFRGFWKSTNKLSPRPGLPVSVDNVSDPKCIANLFREHFSVKSILHDTESEIDEGTGVADDYCTRFSSKDIAEVIEHMTRGKSPGHDSLSIEHLQYAGSHLPRVLSMLFGFCVSHSYLPNEMTKTMVVPIVKNKTGDIGSKSNYRPISLATIIAKVLDSLINKELDKYLHIHDAQFGFRPGLSTESAIACLKEAVGYYTQRSTPVLACFLDLSKAFDLVNYGLLWSKLQEAKVPEEVICVLRYWYTTQVNYVKWGNARSDEYRLECGVRQGGLSSPKLFNIYVNALIDELSKMRVGCRIQDVSFNNISYADDMCLLSPSVNGLRKLLDVCEKYAATHGLKYNVTKSEFMVFKAGRKGCSYIPPLLLNGVPLNRVYKFKYLGHVVTEDMRDDDDIERERRALATRANMVAHRFRGCSLPVKVTLFRAYCTSMYTCSLWTNHTKQALKAICVQYNDAFRVLARLPRWCSASGMFADAHVDGFPALLRARCAAALRRVRASANTLLEVIAGRWDSKLVRHWTGMHSILTTFTY